VARNSYKNQLEWATTVLSSIAATLGLVAMLDFPAVTLQFTRIRI
jgi:hypothetical protein